MLKWALIFFLISLVAGFFGFTGVAAGAAGIAKVLFFLFLIRRNRRSSYLVIVGKASFDGRERVEYARQCHLSCQRNASPSVRRYDQVERILAFKLTPFITETFMLQTMSRH